MRLCLKENPREWQKFTTATAFGLGVASTLLWRRHLIGRAAYYPVIGLLILALVTCLVRPRWFRSFYRGGMRAGFAVGQVVGRILLTLIFFALLTPLALVARLLGKDPLKLKPNARASTFWQPARPEDDFDRQF
jgi:Saxitoxin biosynthesis operon protein SxtJ